jgi:hypothetical protein
VTGEIRGFQQACISPDVLARCLALIDEPTVEPLTTQERMAKTQYLTCEIGWIVSFLKTQTLHQRHIQFKTAKAIKDEYLDVAKTFERAARLLKEWHPGHDTPPFPMSRHPFDDMIAYDRKVAEVSGFLVRLARDAKESAKRVPAKLVADMGKFSTAVCALLLLKIFGSRPPTLTSEGPFFQLTANLYEAATGIREVSLERQCRRAFNSGLAKKIRSRAMGADGLR